MSEQFEKQLSDHLQALPLSDDVPDLAQRSIRRGEQLRRRRIAAMALLVVMLLAIPGATAAWLRVSNTDQPPVTTPTTPAAPTGPQYLTLDPLNRSEGAPPDIGYVRDREVRLASGATVALPTNQVGTVTEFGAGAAWLTRNPDRMSLNVAPQPLPLTDDTEVTGVDPGPAGSVLVRTTAGPLLWTAAATLLRPSQPVLKTTSMVATADALWVSDDGRVTRVDLSDPTRTTYPTRSYPEWTAVVTSDVRSNHVIVTDDDGCRAVLDGTTAALVWRTCDHEIMALSPDGRLAAGRSLDYRTLDVLDVGTGKLRLRIDTDATRIDVDTGPATVSTDMIFDDRGRLNLRVGDHSAPGRVVTVDVTGTCWISAGPYPTLALLLPNQD